ncbi:restriction endonuclease subunit S [Microbacterium sp. Sa4CUA7]|uniref:Restriction endonuclease subunit S n=1 Tax=Microbacterium pullorum TaxID=2762236 RepID=A0ABR8S1Z5_9MICO|nr:restriction endonuclease subunit S [Microbacterium pullorum]MBD7957480.1 restriction endonuclease subunit S [Microbacterium pullorum]
MTEWRDVTLGEVCELKRGYDLPRGSRAVGSVPVISSSGPTGWHDEAKVKAPGVVTGRYGTLGQVFYVTEDFWPLNTSLYVRDFKGNDPRFVAVLLRSMDLAKYDGAAAVPGLNRNHLHTLSVRVPELSVQASIAQVAQALDDLIENNRRRLELLEKMARSIYREWFVKFRYPGHGDVPLVDSALGPIPQGWRAGTIGEVLELKYGKALKASARRGGAVAVVSSAGIVGWHDESFVSGPTIVVGRKGNVGSIHWVDGPCWPIDTAYYVDTGLPLRFVAEQLRRTRFTNTHAAVPGLSREAAYARPFLVPPLDVLEAFQTAVDPLGAQATALGRQTGSLAALRDLLLPRLVTGQIDVSALDLGALVEGAVT